MRPKKSAGTRPARPSATHRLRIVAGAWRGSRLEFPRNADIRPTPDRVRETLFNWLAGRIGGARCLDLFAGSGALGFEALSRAAAEVLFVERDAATARYLRETLARFRCDRGRVLKIDAWRYLEGPARSFDVVFIDPPFGLGWPSRALAALVRGGWLAPDARVYLESEAATGEPGLPAGWVLLRQGRAGEVGYYLAGAMLEKTDQGGRAGEKPRS